MPHFQRYHTYKNAYLTIGLSFLGSIILHIPLCLDHKVSLCSSSSSEIETFAPPSSTSCIYTIEDNVEISDRLWYKAYIGISETLLRVGPIFSLTILNILIIVKFCRFVSNQIFLHENLIYRLTFFTHRIAKKRQGLRGSNRFASKSFFFMHDQSLRIGYKRQRKS